MRYWDASTGAFRNVLGIHHEIVTREGEDQNVHRDKHLLFSRHEAIGGGISRLLFSPDGKTLATASRISGAVRIWDTQAETDQFPTLQSPDYYSSIAFSPDHKLAAVGDENGTVALWDTERLSRISEVPGAHRGPVYAVAFSPRGDRLVSTGADRVVKRWVIPNMQQDMTFAGPPERSRDLPIGKLFVNDKVLVNVVREESALVAKAERSDAVVRDLAAHRNPIQVSAPLIVLSNDGSRLASIDCKIVVWNLVTWSSKAALSNQPCSNFDFQRAALSPEGRYLAIGGPGIGRDSKTNKVIGGVRLLDVTGSRKEMFLPLHLGYSTDDALRSLEFSPDGTLLATVSAVSYRATVTLWEVASGASKRVFVPAPKDKICDGYRGASCSRIGGFSPDGKTIALISGARMPQAGPNELTLWHLDSDRKESVVSNHRVDELVFSSDSKTFATLIASREGAPAIVRDRETGRELASLGNYQSWISSVRCAADDRILAATYEYPASTTMAGKVWDVRKGQLLASQANWGPDGNGAAVIAPDGRSAAGATGSGIVIWSLDGGAAKTTVKGAVWPQSTVFSPDGKLLANALNGQITVSDTSSGRELYSFKGSSPIAFSPTESRMIATTQDCSTVEMWDLNTGRARETYSDDGPCIKSLAFSLDGKMMAAISPGSIFDRVGAEMRLWDVGTERVRVRLKGAEGDSAAPPVFTPDGKTLATPGKGGNVDLWDSLTGRRLLSLSSRGQEVTGLEFSPDGKVIVVGYKTSVGVYRSHAKLP